MDFAGILATREFLAGILYISGETEKQEAQGQPIVRRKGTFIDAPVEASDEYLTSRGRVVRICHIVSHRKSR